MFLNRGLPIVLPIQKLLRLVSKYGFGPAKLKGLSRNGPVRSFFSLFFFIMIHLRQQMLSPEATLAPPVGFTSLIRKFSFGSGIPSSCILKT